MSAVILHFPRYSAASRDRVTDRSKASSEIRPPDLRMIARRHLCGTDFLQRHFFSAAAETPSERAASSTAFQSSFMTAENRDKSSPSQGTDWDDHAQATVVKLVPMKPPHETPTIYRKLLAQRTKALREARGLTQQEMADFLGIKWETYKKYENRSPIPHHLIPKFCTLVGTDPNYLITGQVTAFAAKKIRKLPKQLKNEKISP